MALRKVKDIVSTAVSNYLNATTSKYSKYLEGGPTYVTYYQLDDIASQQDKELETVHSLVGGNTPNKYKKINDMVIYGINQMDIANELNERGLVSNIQGEFLVIPDSVRPYTNDFFTFNYEGLESHLFRVSDVQYDKASPGKYFRCQFEIFQDNADMILGNVESEHRLIYENIGTDVEAIISEDDAINYDNAQNIADDLTNKFTEMFYDVDLDTFLCSHNGKKLWSPYLQHFIYKNKLFNLYKGEFMTEIYYQDITEADYPDYYSEDAYQESIYRAIELQDRNPEFKTNFLAANDVDLKGTRNLPFFASDLEFCSITAIKNLVDYGVENDEKDIDLPDYLGDYKNGFALLFGDLDPLFGKIDHYHKVHKFDHIHLKRVDQFIKVGDIVYECRRNELEPTGIYQKVKATAGMNDYRDGYIDISIKGLLEKDSDGAYKIPLDGTTTKHDLLIDIVRRYLNDELIVNEDLLNSINEFRYKRDFRTFILLPLVIFAIKETIKG